MSRCYFRRSGVQLLDILFKKIFIMWKLLHNERGSLILVLSLSLLQCCIASKLPSFYRSNVNETEGIGLNISEESDTNIGEAIESIDASEESLMRQSPTPFNKTPFRPRKAVNYYSIPSTSENTEPYVSQRPNVLLQRQQRTDTLKPYPDNGIYKERQEAFVQKVPSDFDVNPDTYYRSAEQQSLRRSNKTSMGIKPTHSNVRQRGHIRNGLSGNSIDHLVLPVQKIYKNAVDRTSSHHHTNPKTMMSVISDMMAEASGGHVESDRFSAIGESTKQESRVEFEGDSGDIESDSYAGNIFTKPRPVSAGSQEAPADATLGLLTSHHHGKPKKLIFCYYGTSANSRPSVGKFWPENVDPFLCTHLIFAFADITKDGTSIKPNNWNDLGDNGLYKRTLRLKEKNKDLKILLAVGGWKIGSKPFLPVIESADKWKTWISNVIDYLRRFGFDGLDMDWEFPGWRGSGPEDRHKFTLFMKDLYEAFASEAEGTGKPRLILTLATAASAFYVEKAYEPTQIHKYVDYMLLMTYNFHGSGWEKHTGHHTPLLPHPLDPEGEQRELYVLWAINYWLNFGVPRSKLVMGMASYGLGWKLTDLSQTGIRAPADGGNTKGKYTEESGILSHYEICEHVIQDGWNVEWIDEQKAPYAYGDGEWVGFDSPDSFYIKAVTVLQEGLAGAFIWSVEMDDFNGHCGGPKYPLIRTVYEVFTQHPLSANKSPSHSAQLRLSNARSHVNSAAATHSHGEAQVTASRSSGDHHGSAVSSSGSSSHHSSSLTHYGDYHYEHNPDADGHLTKPWQVHTDYDYEYYDWGDESSGHSHGTETHHSPNPPASIHSHETPSGSTGSHLETSNHDSGSSTHNDDYHYEHDPDADGHLSKPWQAKTDYDYEYYHWDDGSSHDKAQVHEPVSASASRHSHNTQNHNTGSHLESIGHVSSSPDTHHDYSYHNNPDADGHISKPWQAKSDYDYEYYDWGSSHDHTGAVSSDPTTHGHQSTSHDDNHHHDYDLEHIDCNAMGLGIHPSPESCQHFVLCMPINAHELGPSLMVCPSGTLYDDSLKVCNHQHLVHCSR